MGLMTDPKTQKVLITFVNRFHKVGSLLCYLAGVAYMLSLASPTLNAATYFSENALLPGLVDREYSDNSFNVGLVADEYKQVVDGNDGIPASYLERKFTELGLDAYSQNFSVSHPFLETDLVGRQRIPRVVRGTNVYGILRAPRIAGTEAVVLMVPYRGREAAGARGDTHYGVGLMLSLARFFRSKTYWSKDLIFLVVDREEMGTQAWLEAYQGLPSDYIRSSIMQGRSGAIMGAINLEVGAPRIARLDLVTEGINGHLPNLDLINLAVLLCGKEGVPVSFQDQVDPSIYHRRVRAGVHKSARTMLLNMAHQASGRPRAVHGLFLQYHIEAVTIRAAAAQKSGKGLKVAGRVLEGVVRSLNNLLERLHQSFFFYILPNLDRYVSIGLYTPPFALLMMVPLLNGLALWIKSGSNRGARALSKDDSASGDSRAASESEEDVIARPLSSVIPPLIGATLTGALLYISPEYFMNRFSAIFRLPAEEAVCVGSLGLFAGAAMFPHILLRKMPPPADPQRARAEWQVLKSVALIWQAVVLSAISMINFSLAFFLAVAMVPVSAFVKPSPRLPARILHAVLLLLISPPCLLFLFLLAFNVVTSASRDLALLLSATLQDTIHALYQALVDGYLYGNWSYGLATMVVFPNWLMLWLVIWKRV